MTARAPGSRGDGIVAVAGTILGLALFVLPPVLAGRYQVHPAAFVAAAALWAPAFAWPGNDADGLLADLRRYLRAAAMPVLMALPFYLAARYVVLD